MSATAVSPAAEKAIAHYGWIRTVREDGAYVHAKAPGHLLILHLVPIARFGGRPYVQWAHEDEEGRTFEGRGIEALTYHLMRTNMRLGVGDTYNGWTV